MTRNTIATNRRHITLSFIVLFFIGWYLFGANQYSVDIDNYRNLYYRATLGGQSVYEPGFYMLCAFFNECGMSFEFFLKIYGSIAFILIGSTIIRYSKHPGMVMIAFMLYPFLLDCAQIRHFMAYAIFIFAIRYLEQFSIKNIILFVIFIFISISFQITAIAFIIFLLSYISKSKIAYLCGIAVSGLFIMGSALKYSGLYIYIMNLRDKGSIYEDSTPLGQLIMYCVFYGLISYFALHIPKTKNRDKSYVIDNNVLIRISLLSLIFIPLLTIDFQYTRLYRACLIPVYLSATNNIGINQNNIKRELSYLILFMTLIAVSLKLFGPSGGYYKTLTAPILFHQDYIVS